MELPGELKISPALVDVGDVLEELTKFVLYSAQLIRVDLSESVLQRLGDQNGVTLKFTNDEDQSCKLSMAALKRELTLLLRISHPNIVPLIGYATDPFFIALEQFHVTMGQVIQSGGTSMSSRAHAKLVAGVVDGVAVLHRSGVAHMDINPFNIAIVNGDTAKLFNFDKAIVLNELEQDGHIEDYGCMANFTAPETLSANSMLASADLFSIDIYATGNVILSLISSTIPHHGMDRESVKCIVESSQRLEWSQSAQSHPLYGCGLEACTFDYRNRPIADALVQLVAEYSKHCDDDIGGSLRANARIDLEKATTEAMLESLDEAFDGMGDLGEDQI
jgi:serine/threonine protein kinase